MSDRRVAAGPTAAGSSVAAVRWPGRVRVAIVGAGFGGLGAAVGLARAGIDDFVILERAHTVGGTWRDNTYPGCACDVPSNLYSFSFAPNPNWTHRYSRQPEIQAYLESVTDRFGLWDRLAVDTELLAAEWDDATARWRLRTSRGTLEAQVLVVASGPLAEPSTPPIPGLDAFPGRVFHSARWDHGAELAGRRVAVVGTGASAVQIVPHIQRRAAHLVLLQRTPGWVVPRADRRFSPVESWLLRRVPLTQRLSRFATYASREALAPALTRHPKLLRVAQRVAQRHLRQAVKDPALRAKLTPSYVIGCKRILLSDDYYPALTQSNVEVIASGLERVEGSTVVAGDGSRAEVDAIVLATGFNAVEPPVAQRIFDGGGRSLASVWGQDMQALRGTTVAGFPNLCLVIGPNTGLGHNSMVHVIESQVRYIVDYLRKIESARVDGWATRPEAQDRWSAEVERHMARTVWATGGCSSWYLNAAGRNPTLWPGTTLRLRRSTRRVDLDEFRPVRAGQSSREGVAKVSTAEALAAGVPTRTLRVPSSDGVELHVEVHGRADGPTVVLCHGWTCTSKMWEPLIAELAKKARVVAYDQRGHGLSAAPTAPPERRGAGPYQVDKLVDDLDAVLAAVLPAGQKAILVGHSMGGMTIMAAGRRTSVVERSAGAVLASTGFADLAGQARVVPLPWAMVVRLAHGRLLRSAVPLGRPTPLSRAVLRYACFGPKSSPVEVAMSAELIHACNRRTRAGWGRVLDSLDVGDGVDGLTFPVQVVVGAADRMTPPVHAARLAARLPNCVGLTELPGVGHMLPIEAPHALAGVVLDVLAWLSQAA